MCLVENELYRIQGDSVNLYSSTLTIHTLHVNIPCGVCIILLTLVVVAFTDETHDVWCTVVDPVDCWLIVVLVFVNIVVMMGTDDEELNASNISTYNNNKYNKSVYVKLNMSKVHT